MDAVSMDYSNLKNVEMQNQLQMSVMKKSMDAAVDQNQQLLNALPKMPTEPGLGGVLDQRA